MTDLLDSQRRPPMRQPSVSSSPILQGLITWLAYTLSGLLSMWLATTGTHVSQLYLASGIGLGLTLGWGLNMLWAVGVGCASVVLLAQSWLHPELHLDTVAVEAILSGIGAALQGWLGVRLTVGKAGRPLDLDRPAAILKFLLMAGPVACVANAVISVQTMSALGLVEPHSWLEYTVRWWAGDTMGVLLATPLVLTMVGQPESLWRARRWVVGGPMIAAAILLGLAVHQVQSWDQERETAVFERDVTTVTDEVALKLNGYMNAIEALNSVYQSSNDVTEREFETASHYWLQNLDGLQALGWAEYLTRAQLNQFEAQAQADGLQGYRVFDRNEKTEERTPPKGDEFVALRYINPRHGNERALGLNILGMGVTREAYERSLAADRPIATHGFRLTQESGIQTGVVVYRPVYMAARSSHLAPDAPKQIRGALFLTLRMDDMVESMLQGLPRYLSACLLESSDDGEGAAVLGGHQSCHQGDWGSHAIHRQVVPLTFAGASWQMVVWAHDRVPLVVRGTTSSWLSIGGVIAATALCAMLLVISGHTQKIEQAVKEARNQREAAEAASHAKSEFLSRMSHELRTPLNAVLGFAQVMDMDSHSPLPPVQHQRLKQIQQAGWHLLDMIDDVLDISRIETGTLRLTAEPVPIGDAIAQACQDLNAQASNVGIELIWPQDVPPDWGVQADPGRLRQILHTLLDNGITYNQRPGSVTVSVSRQQAADSSSRMVITVKDTGMGMSPDQVAQLFQPFNRLGREKQVPDGAGVGLAIGRHLATLMGGELEASSREGEGATFTLSLPAATIVVIGHAPADVAHDRPTEVAAPDTPRHVLYVEDNLANSEVMRAALADRPWIRLSVAPTIEQGLAVLHNRLQGPKPSLILLDVHLPDASGLEFLRLVKANPETSDIPVIMVSADAMPEQIEAALAAGAACYLTKPVQLSELRNQVDALLKRSET
ncbi:MAG TPA: CHASE domain-containing protein [Aquabacterium sp.]|nr:CHASE domain-containing protein [Aquabacterium sp.]